MKAETKGLIAGAVGLAGLAITGVATRSSTGPVRGLGSLGLSRKDHAIAAERPLRRAWQDLERMPPTCHGGIALAARALENATVAKAHLNSMRLMSTTSREDHKELIRDANRAVNAAQKAVDFFKRTCDAPHEKTERRPLFSRRR